MLKRVVYMPTGKPPHKQEQTVTDARHRLNMTRLAVAGNEAFSVSELDVRRPGPHYTSTLRPYLAEAFPTVDFVLLIGGDSLHDLSSWHEPQKIVAEWNIAVLSRPGSTLDWKVLEAEVAGVRQSTTVLEGPSVAVSSTQIRRWASIGRSLRYLVPEAVAQYISQNALYSPAREAPSDAANYSPDASATGPT
jgi:nicotinate-nucleotide adenylyltransferase